jgi:hypothetical protein
MQGERIRMQREWFRMQRKRFRMQGEWFRLQRKRVPLQTNRNVLLPFQQPQTPPWEEQQPCFFAQLVHVGESVPSQHRRVPPGCGWGWGWG